MSTHEVFHYLYNVESYDVAETESHWFLCSSKSLNFLSKKIEYFRKDYCS